MKDLSEILRLHALWLAGDSAGERANLSGATLTGATLTGATLTGATLTGATLTGATLDDGLTLTGLRPIVQAGPIGSRQDYLVCYSTDHGPRFRAGCWFGDEAQFRDRIAEVYGDTQHGQEYLAALEYCLTHCRLWPAGTEVPHG